jgi:hypothetical protein
VRTHYALDTASAVQSSTDRKTRLPRSTNQQNVEDGDQNRHYRSGDCDLPTIMCRAPPLATPPQLKFVVTVSGATAGRGQTSRVKTANTLIGMGTSYHRNRSGEGLTR